MYSALFHSEVFLPASVRAPIHEGRLTYSRHAWAAANNDRYGVISLPLEFHAADATLIEAEVVLENYEQKVVKQVWRQRLDETRDLILVIRESGKVSTVWVNLRSDSHRSLDSAKYMKA